MSIILILKTLTYMAYLGFIIFAVIYIGKVICERF